MTTRIRRNVAFTIGLFAVVAMSGFLLRAAAPQDVGTWQVTGTTDPSSARTGAATATLEDGSTFIAGGRLGDGTITDSVVVYDPLTNASTTVGHLLSPRVNAAAARLDDGRVLVVGGEVADLPTADAEIFDPNTGASDGAGVMAQPRTRHAATRLADGRVLIVGGATVDGVALASVEVFDPAAGILTVSSMATARVGASATLLIDNRVLVVGGNSGNGTLDLASAELYHPFSNEFVPVDTQLSVARSGHTATLLPHNGAVLVAGGTAAGVPVTDVDLFLPAMFPDPYSWGMGSFAPAAPLAGARSHAVAGPAGDDGYAFVAGGGVPVGEAYAFTTIRTDKDDYAPGERALITGSGWRPGEEVELVFQEDPAVHPDYTLTLIADGDGKISHDEWAPEWHDFGVRFYLMATGQQSHHLAQATFTDGNRVTFSLTAAGAVVSTFTSVTPGQCTDAFVQERQGNNLDVAPLGGRTVTLSSAPLGATFYAGAGCPGSSVGSVTIAAGAAAAGFSFKIAAASPNPYTITGNAGFTGNNNATGTITVTGAVSQTITVTTAAPATAAYGSSFNVAATASSGLPVAITTTGACSGSGTASATVTMTSGTGSCSVAYNQAGNASFDPAATVSSTTTATKAATVTTVTIAGGPFSYTGSALTPATVTVAGPGGLSLTPPAVYANNVNAGTASASYSYLGDGNYAPSSDSKPFVIGRASAVVVVTPYTVTYDGAAHTAAVTSITGVNGETGATVGTVDVSNTTHTVAGTYSTDYWTFTGTANYNSIAATTITDTINRANAVVVVTPYTVTYDGAAHTAAVTSITGVNGETGATVGTVDVSNTTHTVAGTYSADYWTFTGTANYNSIAATTITDTINRANAVVVVTPYTVTYDGAAHTAAVTSITGVNGETGATVGTVDVSNTTHTVAGTYSADYWTFTGTANYNSIAATTITDTINRANAVVVVTPYTVTYDGAAHTAAVTSITGVNGETGATVGTVDVSNTTHTVAGTYSADYWTFTGTANYNSIAATTIIDTINRADAVVVVTPYTVTYDGNAHTATVTSITGVNGETGATVGTVDVSNTTHTAAGTYSTDSWSFTGTANYNNIAATTITDTINKADAVVVVTPYTVTYDGAAHTAAVTSITGVAGQSGATVGTVDVTNTTHTDAGTYASDSWSFTGTANYNNIAATTITDTINKADAVVVVTPYAVTYDGAAHTAAVTSITGVAGQSGATVGTVDVTNTTHTNAGVYNADTWSFTGTANYNNIAATTITDTINKADATVTANNKTKTYGAVNPALDATVVGQVVGGDAINYSLATTATQFSSVAGSPYPITVTLGSNPNYTVTPANGSLTINAALATVTANNKVKTYGAGNPPLDATVVGEVAGGDAVNYTLATAATQFSSVAGSPYPITVTLGSNPNYTVTPANGSLTINAALATVTANNKVKTYGAGNPPLTATVVGEVAGGDAVNYTLATTATQFSSVAGSPYAITVTLGSNPNYTVTPANGSLTIDAALATVTANNKTKIYGLVNPPLDATVVGQVVGGDPVNYTLATTATQFSTIGTYPITVTLGSNPNYSVTKTDGTLTVETAFCFNGFLSPIGGAVENVPANGGSYADPVRSFKLGSTIPVKFALNSVSGSGCGGVVTTGVHSLQVLYYSTAVDSDPAIDATPTDAATTGNQFRLTGTEWHFNLSTKGGVFKAGTWLVKATLQDGSTKSVWIAIKK